MANEFNAKGRRMVFEEDIEKIGQGGGSEYTAGNGINITDNEISVDSDVAMKTDVVNFTDFVDLGDSLRDLTETEYNQVLNGLKRPKYRGMVYQVSHIVLEPDWSGFTGLILQPTTLNGVETGQGQVKSWFMRIHDGDYSTPYYVEVSDNNLVVANDADTPSETLTTLRVGSGVYSVGGGSSETTYGSKDLYEDTWDNLVTNGMPVLTSETIANGTEFLIDGVVGIEYTGNRVVLYNATSYANAFSNHNFNQPIRMRKTGTASYKVLNGYLNGVTDKTQDYYFEAHGFTSNEGSSVNYTVNSTGVGFNPLFVQTQRDSITLDNRYLSSSVTERKIHNMLNIPRTTAGDYVLSCSTQGNIITEFGWKQNEIPPCPTTTDGTYTLQATVSSGTVTYSWVLVTP